MLDRLLLFMPSYLVLRKRREILGEIFSVCSNPVHTPRALRLKVNHKDDYSNYELRSIRHCQRNKCHLEVTPASRTDNEIQYTQVPFIQPCGHARKFFRSCLRSQHK